MLTRYSHKSIVAITTQKKGSHSLATVYTNDTKAVSKDIPLFFCVMYPHICTFQGYIEQETFIVCRFPFVSARQPVLCSPFCFGEHRGLPFNLFTNGGATMHTNATVPQSFDFVKTLQFKAVWNISESIRKNLRPSINKITMLKEFLVYADMEEVFIQDNSDDVLSGIIEVIDDLLNGFNAVSDNISDIYNDIEEFNEVKNV